MKITDALDRLATADRHIIGLVPSCCWIGANIAKQLLNFEFNLSYLILIFFLKFNPFTFAVFLLWFDFLETRTSKQIRGWSQKLKKTVNFSLYFFETDFHLSSSLSLSHYFFLSFEENGVIKNGVTQLIRGRKLISVKQNYIKVRTLRTRKTKKLLWKDPRRRSHFL